MAADSEARADAVDENDTGVGGEDAPTLKEVREHSRRKTLGIRAVSAAVMLGIVAAAWYFLGDRGIDIVIAAVAAICFLEFIFLVIKATANIPFRLAGILAGAAYIGLAAVILIDFDLQPLYITLASVIFADVFAYGFGTLIGGPRILPRVSPNKTWAGLLGGMVGATLALMPLFVIAYLAQQYFNMQMLIGILIAGPVLAAVSLAGDLFESWLKRKAGVKDSSSLIPGHGGFLDRFDGVLPVAIVVGIVVSVSL
ncbi:phosphatidate cytidylyltransferase [Alteriqipengyuania lutimaris]|uniref:Phosphatidate cytidylyltransferase n=1 Tax=Alteriqipengyuania lutimaris TaxID=1538146 RepID=A0A395LNI9_9SPHN|nr:phosphatidate cytidylyltransferase [Alteriqipengyuania lutimaris]MBB3032568.1 phosphatidate cytidylyltransferase [Alteriqipengyuania lutimaris]RDS78305.1 phosphatidate cytidylyltransferase [Alteriqipengyuania lutimaris]